MRMDSFVIGRSRAVIANLRVSENDDLTGVRGICEDFLVSGDGGIEDYFAGAFGGRTKTPALEDGSVLQSQDCRIQQFPPGVGVKTIVRYVRFCFGYKTGESLPSICLRTILMGGIPWLRNLS